MKKGFTLIELLAVIVILAIIATIATPIIVSIIKDSKESALLSSAQNYLDAVEQAIASKSMQIGSSFNPNVCEIQSDSSLLCGDTENLKIEAKGTLPIDGKIVFEDRKVAKYEFVYNKDNIIIDGRLNPKFCFITKDYDKDGFADVGDVITCSTESFYVLSNEDGNISMLSKYNLDIGTVSNSTNPREYQELEDKTLLQNKDIKGCTQESEICYGTVRFADVRYWRDSSNKEFTVPVEGSYPFVFNYYEEEHGKIYSYIKSYEDYLKNEHVKSANVTLISYDQLESLGCSYSSTSCASSKYYWLYSTSYWTGSVHGGAGIAVKSDATFTREGYVYYTNGIRPVVNISLSELGKVEKSESDKSICKLIEGEPNTIGSKYQCKVKDDMEEGFEDGYYFFVLSHNDDGTTNLIMERNMYYDSTNDVGVVATSSNSNVAWYSSAENNSYGPVTAMTYLHNATKDWDNVPDMIMNYEDENIDTDTQQKGTTGYGTILTKGVTVITSKYNRETLRIEDLKTRMPRYDEVYGEGKCTYKNGSCPLWLVNYTTSYSAYPTSNGKIEISGIYGYWTLSSDADYSTLTAWDVNSYGSVSRKIVDIYSDFGVRPVITLKL